MDLLKLIAKSADVCLKPWIHAVVPIDPSAPAVLDELNVRIECRDLENEYSIFFPIKPNCFLFFNAYVPIFLIKLQTKYQ